MADAPAVESGYVTWRGRPRTAIRLADGTVQYRQQGTEYVRAGWTVAATFRASTPIVERSS